MKNFLKDFLGEDRGQDLVEYGLFLGFVVMASAALFISAGDSVKGTWSDTNRQLSRAKSALTSHQREHDD